MVLADRNWLSLATNLSTEDPGYRSVRNARRNLLYHRGENEVVEREILADPLAKRWEHVFAELNLVLLEDWTAGDASKSKALLEKRLMEYEAERAGLRYRLTDRSSQTLVTGGGKRYTQSLNDSGGLARNREISGSSILSVSPSIIANRGGGFSPPPAAPATAPPS